MEAAVESRFGKLELRVGSLPKHSRVEKELKK